MKFTSITFSFDPGNETVKKIRVEVVMQYQAPMNWKVKVLVYDKEREANERGEVKE